MKKIILALLLVLVMTGNASATYDITNGAVKANISGSAAASNVVTITLSTTKYVNVYTGVNGYLDGVVCTVSGTTISNGLVKQNINNDSRTVSTIAGCALSDSAFAVCYKDSSGKMDIVICTVSDTTITAGERQYDMDGSYGIADGKSMIEMVGLSSSLCAVVWKDGSTMTCTRAFSVSGTVVTAGTINRGNLVSPAAGDSLSACKLTSSSYAVVTRPSGNTNTFAEICTVSGTTVTANGDTYIDTSYGTYITCARLSDTSFVFAYMAATTYYANAVICTVSSNTVSFGSIKSNLSGSVALERIKVCSDGAPSFFLVYSGTSDYADALACTVSGTTITEGTIKANISGSVAFYDYGAVALSSTSFVTSFRGTSTYLDSVCCTASFPPGVPGNPTFSNVANKAMTISWTAASGATSYTLQRNGSNISTSATSPYNDSGLAINTSYTYRVIAVNADGSTNCAVDQTQATSYWSKKINGSTIKKINGTYVDKVNGI